MSIIPELAPQQQLQLSPVFNRCRFVGKNEAAGKKSIGRCNAASYKPGSDEKKPAADGFGFLGMIVGTAGANTSSLGI